jgi:hypothetical protein
MSLYTEAPTSQLARLVAEKLAVVPSLLSFFGADRITVLSRAEAQTPIRTPLLGIVPLEVKPVRVGEDLEINLPVLVRFYLPVETPIARRTPPAAPTVAQGAASTTSGTFWYRISDADSAGESAASAAVSITVTNKTPVLTFPATARSGFRIWRATAEDGQYHYAGLHLGSGGTWSDTVTAADLRDELAPILDYQEMLVWAAIKAMFATPDAEMLEDGGRQYADAALNVDPRGPVLITRRNLMLYEFNATFPIVVNAATGQNVTSGA